MHWPNQNPKWGPIHHIPLQQCLRLLWCALSSSSIVSLPVFFPLAGTKSNLKPSPGISLAETNLSPRGHTPALSNTTTFSTPRFTARWKRRRECAVGMSRSNAPKMRRIGEVTFCDRDEDCASDRSENGNEWHVMKRVAFVSRKSEKIPQWPRRNRSVLSSDHGGYLNGGTREAVDYLARNKVLPDIQKFNIQTSFRCQRLPPFTCLSSFPPFPPSEALTLQEWKPPKRPQ